MRFFTCLAAGGCVGTLADNGTQFTVGLLVLAVGILLDANVEGGNR